MQKQHYGEDLRAQRTACSRWIEPIGEFERDVKRRMCDYKKPFRSRREASRYKRATRRNQEGQGSHTIVRSYRCVFCGQWHNGHSMKHRAAWFRDRFVALWQRRIALYADESIPAEFMEGDEGAEGDTDDEDDVDG